MAEALKEELKEEKEVEKTKVKKKYNILPINNEGELLDLGNVRIKSPQNLVIVKYPKSGSTLAMVNVPKILIIDSEHGTDDFPCNNKVNLLDETGEVKFEQTKKYGYIPTTIYNVVTELYQANHMKEYWDLKNRFDIERDRETKQGMYEKLVAKINAMPFPIVCIDTITSITYLSNTAALYEYNLTVKDVSKKADIKRVDEYGGVQYIRRKFDEVKRFIEQNASPFIIYAGHIAMRKKVIKKGEEELSAIDIALEGLLSTIFTANARAVCVFHREEDGCFLDFQKKDESDLGSRPFHLSNKKIKIANILKPEEQIPTTFWQTIYPEINFTK